MHAALRLIFCSLAACSASDKPPAAVATETVSVGDTATWQPSLTGFGLLRAGMSLSEAQAVTGPTFTLPARATPDQCDYAEWPTMPPGMRIMFEGGRLGRVEVDSAFFATPGGVRVGDALTRVDSLYPSAERRPHKYEDGVYVIAAGDSLHRLVIEVVRDTVRKWRVGKLPQVEYVEGCA